MFKKFLTKRSLAVLSTILICGTASAASLDSSYDSRGAFSFPLGDVSVSSYDGPAFNAFSSFSTFTAPDLIKLNSFTGHPLGSQLEITLLSESACFDGTMFPTYANKFGVLNASGDFTSLIDSKTATSGASATLTQGASESLTFALMSPEGMFSTIDLNNSDSQAHILGKVVDKAGTYTIDPTNMFHNTPLTFDFQVGDIILFMEDMRSSGNVTNFIVPGLWDADFNDMVVIIRQTALPEPTTAALLLFGAPALIARRKRQAAQKA